MRVVIFDKWEGGNGVAHAAFEQWPLICSTALRLLESCPCTQVGRGATAGVGDIDKDVTG